MVGSTNEFKTTKGNEMERIVYKPEPPKDGIVIDDGPIAPITEEEIEEARKEKSNGKDEN